MLEYNPTEPGDVVNAWRNLTRHKLPAGHEVLVGIGKFEEQKNRYEKMPGERESATFRSEAF